VALTEIGDPRAEEYFVSLLNDPDPALRIYASVGLMNVGGRISIKLLLSSLSRPETHWLAVKILDQISDRDIDLLIEALKDEKTRWYARQKLIEIDGAALPALEDGLRSEDPLTRGSIAMVLGEVRDSRAVKPLIEAIKDEENFVMSSAASLIQIGDPTSVEPLIELLSSQSEQVRLYAAYALGGLNDARAIEPLVTLLQDPNSTIRGVATHALGELGASTVATSLIVMLEDPSAEVRLSAVHALAKIRERRALDRLDEMVATDTSPQVRRAAKDTYDAIRRDRRR
jgi:HEAT repeat protein